MATGGQRPAAVGRFLRQGDGAAGHFAGDHGSSGPGFLPNRDLARRDAALVVRRRAPLRSFPPGYLFWSSERAPDSGIPAAGLRNRRPRCPRPEPRGRQRSRVSLWRFDCAKHSEARPGIGVAARGAENGRWRPAAGRSNPAGRGDVFGDRTGIAHAGPTSVESLGVEVVRSGDCILEPSQRIAAGARPNGGAGGEPPGFSDLAHLYASAGESGGGRPRAGAGRLRVSAAGARRRRSRGGHRNLRPHEKESAENAKGVAGRGTAGNDRADG